MEKTAMQIMLNRIEEKLTAGYELGYDDNHEGMIQLLSFKRIATELRDTKEREQIVEAFDSGISPYGEADGEEYYSDKYEQE